MIEATCKTCPWSHSDGTECRVGPPQSLAGTDGNGNPIAFAVGRETRPDYWCASHPGRRVLNRDAVAAMALPAVIPELWGDPDGTAAIAECAYQIADAMIAEAAKKKEP